MQPFDNSLSATWNPSNSYGVKANLRSNIEESYALNYLPTATSRDWPIYAEHSGREAANWHSRSGRAIEKTWIRCWLLTICSALYSRILRHSSALPQYGPQYFGGHLTFGVKANRPAIVFLCLNGFESAL
jgi:hypothetical protein